MANASKEETKKKEKENGGIEVKEDFVFQATNGKLIHTEYFNEVFSQFTTIFDAGEKKSSLPPLPKEILAEVEQ